MDDRVLAAIKVAATKLQGMAKREYLETHMYLKTLQKAYIHCMLDNKPGSEGGRFDNLQKLAPLADLYEYFHHWIEAARRLGEPVLASSGNITAPSYQTCVPRHRSPALWTTVLRTATMCWPLILRHARVPHPNLSATRTFDSSTTPVRSLSPDSCSDIRRSTYWLPSSQTASSSPSSAS